MLARRRQNVDGGKRANLMPYRPVEPPLFAHLSPMAVKKLVELDPTPYLLIDVRHPDASRMEPKLFDSVINIPGTPKSLLPFNVLHGRFMVNKFTAGMCSRILVKQRKSNNWSLTGTICRLTLGIRVNLRCLCNFDCDGSFCAETEVRACLQLPAAEWNTKFPSTKKPGREDLMVFLSNRGKRAQRVAAAAADLGYNG